MRKHQQHIVDKDPKKCGIFYGTGSGKTRIGLSLAQGDTLVVAPKLQTEDKNWEKEYVKMGLTSKTVLLTVMSKEKFKKVYKELPPYDTLIIDEAHTVCGVYPDTKRKKGKTVPKASQLYEAVQWYVKNKEPPRVYLLTATPTRNPMAVWAASKLLGRGCDFYMFRNRFYFMKKMNGYDRWFVKKDKESKALLGKLVRKIGFTGKLQDWMDVPEQTEKYVNCPLTKEQKDVISSLHLDFPDPLVLFGKTHQVENGVLYRDEWSEREFYNNNKLKAIQDLVEEFPKVIIFAKYKNQILHIKNAIESSEIETYVLTGETKNRGELIAKAEAADRCVFIAQSGISAGYELPSFRCTIFASASYVHLDLEQARGRNLRMNKLEGANNLYVYLVSGDADKAVWDALEHKQDFHEAVFVKDKKP